MIIQVALGHLLRFFLFLILVGAALAWFYFAIPEVYAMAFGSVSPLWGSLVVFALLFVGISAPPFYALYFAWIIARGK